MKTKKKKKKGENPQSILTENFVFCSLFYLNISAGLEMCMIKSKSRKQHMRETEMVITRTLL